MSAGCQVLYKAKQQKNPAEGTFLVLPQRGTRVTELKPVHAFRVALACCALVAAGEVSAQGTSRIEGCWRSDRPLGPVGGVESIGRDQAYGTFVLQDSGRVAFPLISLVYKQMWESRSYWFARGDSVTLRSFTGLQGWDATLVRAADRRSMAGHARYLTDAIAVGAPPTIVAVTLARVACDASWPSVRPNLPPLPLWQRGEAVYFEHQVDRRAVVHADAALPPGIMTIRALREGESAKLDPSDARPGIGRVVVQMIVQSNGRVDSASGRVRASDGDEYSARVLRALTALRFQPAMLAGVPVHQLTAQRFELRR